MLTNIRIRNMKALEDTATRRRAAYAAGEGVVDDTRYSCQFV